LREKNHLLTIQTENRLYFKRS